MRPRAHSNAPAVAHPSRSAAAATRRLIALAATIALGAGLALFGVSAPASAHTGDLHATAVCNSDTGRYDVTYTLSLTNVGSNLTGETMWRTATGPWERVPTSAANMDRGPIASKGNTTLTLGTESLPGTATTSGPWAYAFTTWSDGYTKGSDGQLRSALRGDCTKTPTEVAVVDAPTFAETCGTDNYELTVPADSEFIEWNRTLVDGIITVTATATGGSTLADGATALWTFTVDDSLCATVVHDEPSVTDTCGPQNEHVEVPENTDLVTWSVERSNETVSITATAAADHTFAEGATKEWKFNVSDADCVTVPPATDDDGGVPLANTGGPAGSPTSDDASPTVDGADVSASPLAETGFTGGMFVWIAGLLLAAGAALLVVLGIRRSRQKNSTRTDRRE